MSVGINVCAQHRLAQHRLAQDGFEVLLDEHTGALSTLVFKGHRLTIDKPHLPIDVSIDGKWLSEKVIPSQARVLEIKLEQHSLKVSVSVSDFQFNCLYKLHEGNLLERRVEIVYTGEAKPKINCVAFRLPPLRISNGDLLLSPHFDFLRLPANQQLRFSSDGLYYGAWAGVYNDSKRMGVISFFYAETERFNVSVVCDEGVRIAHEIFVQDRLREGWKADLGSQFIMVAEGDETDLLERIWKAYEALGVRLLGDTPKEIFAGAMYETGIDYPSLRKLLPHIRSLGVSVIWLMPYTPGGYAPTDYYKIRPELGTEDDLRALVSDAHRHGMKVILDLIPHGPQDESELAKHNPDWVCLDEQGRRTFWWGCLAFDYAHKGWQNYMAEVASYFAKNFDIDGWRVDCAAGGPPNWRDGLSYRPSQSGLFGGLNLLKSARNRFKQVKPNPIFYPEASGAPFFAYGDIVYDFPFALGVLRRFASEDASSWCEKARRYLQHHRFTLPKGAALRVVRYLENHDAPQSQRIFGIGPMKALFALICSIEGMPFIFQDQDVGCAPYIRKLLETRRRCPELVEGEADYLDVQVSHPFVFAVRRFVKSDNCVALVNLSGKAIRCKVNLPVGRMFAHSGPTGAYRVVDLWSGRTMVEKAAPEKLAAMQVDLLLLPFSPAFLLIRKMDEFKLLPKKLGRKTPAWKFSQLRRDEQSVSFRFAGVNGTISSDGSLLLSSQVPLMRMSFREGAWKLAPGKPDIGFQTVERMRLENSALKLTTALQRRIGEKQVQVGTLRWQYQFKGDELCLRISFERKRAIKLARCDLDLVTEFFEPAGWFVSTFEGCYLDDFVARRPKLKQWTLWESNRIPLSQGEEQIAVAFKPLGWLKFGSLKVGTATLSQTTEPKSLLLTISPDENGAINLKLRGEPTQPSEFPEISRRALRYRVEGPNCVFAIGKYEYEYEAVVSKVRGGLIRRIQSERGSVLLDGSEIYSDYGIYPEHDEGGWARGEDEKRMVRTVGKASVCHDPEKVLLTSNSVSFHGALCTTWGGHWWRLSPRVEYSLQYASGGDALLVKSAVRPKVPLFNVRAFLAMTLNFRGIEKCIVNTEDGEVEVKEIGERDWESRKTPLSKTKPYIRLIGKDYEMKLECLLGDMQNIFLLKSNERVIVFFAWLDGQRCDFLTGWHPFEFQVRLHSFRTSKNRVMKKWCTLNI